MIGFVQNCSPSYLRPLSLLQLTLFTTSNGCLSFNRKLHHILETSVRCLLGDSLLPPLGPWQVLCFWDGAYPGRQASQGWWSLKKRMLHIDTLCVKAMQAWLTPVPIISYVTSHAMTDTWHNCSKHARWCWSPVLRKQLTFKTFELSTIIFWWSTSLSRLPEPFQPA